jgi:hypothetical protein
MFRQCLSKSWSHRVGMGAKTSISVMMIGKHGWKYLRKFASDSIGTVRIFVCEAG